LDFEPDDFETQKAQKISHSFVPFVVKILNFNSAIEVSTTVINPPDHHN
jgi:hypothetical protein